ncbi:putative nucleotidyltransferase-like protein [Branchiibius hedensis]|uniref:Uncharacterized nucleotidyltransferase n=2 Tax=Branchiibius hedensis TaxID=672460 RepID=A0A2Y8ZMU8_9MICO|nr:putative nucleotidyltransferase-like protein [Branchiibius hedensis]SSA33265.1 Uncharacterised nucleotidyltransferase [Branchiibius hedensis]
MTLPLAAAVSLGHALVADVAEELHLPALFIKGVVAVQQGLRAEDYVPGDVDVLCAADRAPELIDALAARGWRRRPESSAHARFVTHSTALLHPDWPCDIDVHTRFPGFFADPDVVFEALWEHRERHEVAGVELWGPDYPAHALIVLLHGLRTPTLAKNAGEVTSSTGRFAAMSDAERTATRDLIHRTGASEVVAAELNPLGWQIEVPARPSAQFARWKLNSGPTNTEGWLVAIAEASGTTRLRLIYRAVLPSREDLLIDYPGLPDAALPTARAYVQRLVRAAGLVPPAVRNVVRTQWASRRTAIADPQPPGAAAVGDTAPSSPAPSSPAPGTPAMPSSPASTRVLEEPAPADPAPGAGGRWAVYLPEPAHAVDDEAFVLRLSGGGSSSPMRLNGVGLAILTLLDETGGDVDRAVQEAAAMWPQPTDELRTVITGFQQEMTRLGVLQ